MESQDPWFDIPALLESSQPRPRGPWLFYALGVFLLVVLTSTYVGSHSPWAYARYTR